LIDASTVSKYLIKINLTRSLALAITMAITLLLQGGCSVLDPHNIVGRTHAPSTISETPVPSTERGQWKQAALEMVWNTVNDKYYDPKLNGVDWQAARTKYESLLKAAKSDDDYWELLDKMTGELRDSHTRVHSPKQAAQQRANESHSLGISFLELDDALILTSVHAESDAYWAGARAGMVIKLINNEPALPYYKRLVTEARDSSTARARTRGALRKISSGDVDTSVPMTFLRADGIEITTTLKRRVFRTPPEIMQRVLPSGFGYVRFSNFIGAMESTILTAIDKMKDTPGMIVDLRNNGGGSLGMSGNLMAKFLSEKTKGAKVLTRTGKAPTLMFIETIKLEPELKGSSATAYKKPLVILTNENSASASEVFSAVLQDLGRATVIGTRTCGCLLGYMGYADVPGGGQLAYSELGFISPKGKRIEGEGVAPDIEVQIARTDILQNRDRTLEAAESFLRDRAKGISTASTQLDEKAK
jgi:carboxyl-terminal processing protease